jgi:hypothetical protein
VSILASNDNDNNIDEKEESEAIDHALVRIDKTRTVEHVTALLEEEQRHEVKDELTQFIEQCLISEDKIN